MSKDTLALLLFAGLICISMAQSTKKEVKPPTPTSSKPATSVTKPVVQPKPKLTIIKAKEPSTPSPTPPKPEEIPPLPKPTPQKPVIVVEPKEVVSKPEVLTVISTPTMKITKEDVFAMIKARIPPWLR